MGEISFNYQNDLGINISVKSSEDDVNLTYLFASFVNFTKMIGYMPDSWKNIVKELPEIDSEYTLYDWASDILWE